MTFQVTVQTSSDRVMDKLRRKEEKRVARRFGPHHANGDTEVDGLSSVYSFSSLIQASEREVTGVDALIGKGSAGTVNVGGRALPAGSVRKVYKGYEEIRVPATPTAPMRPDEKLVPHSSILALYVVAFRRCNMLIHHAADTASICI